MLEKKKEEETPEPKKKTLKIVKRKNSTWKGPPVLDPVEVEPRRPAARKKSVSAMSLDDLENLMIGEKEMSEDKKRKQSTVLRQRSNSAGNVLSGTQDKKQRRQRRHTLAHFTEESDENDDNVFPEKYEKDAMSQDIQEEEEPGPSITPAAPRKGFAQLVHKMMDDKSQDNSLVARLNTKVKLIKDPGQFHVLARRVEVLTQEKDMLREYGTALNEENDNLKTMLVSLTKQRCSSDLDNLRGKQLKFQKDYEAVPISVLSEDDGSLLITEQLPTRDGLSRIETTSNVRQQDGGTFLERPSRNIDNSTSRQQATLSDDRPKNNLDNFWERLGGKVMSNEGREQPSLSTVVSQAQERRTRFAESRGGLSTPPSTNQTLTQLQMSRSPLSQEQQSRFLPSQEQQSRFQPSEEQQSRFQLSPQEQQSRLLLSQEPPRIRFPSSQEQRSRISPAMRFPTWDDPQENEISPTTTADKTAVLQRQDDVLNDTISKVIPDNIRNSELEHLIRDVIQGARHNQCLFTSLQTSQRTAPSSSYERVTTPPHHTTTTPHHNSTTPPETFQRHQRETTPAPLHTSSPAATDENVGNMRNDVLKGMIRDTLHGTISNATNLSKEIGAKEPGPNVTSEGDKEACLTVPLDEWDKLKYQANIVLEENQILSDQKTLYKKTINDLNHEYHIKTTSQAREILSLTHEKEALEREIILSSRNKEILQLKMEDMNKAHAQLDEKYNEMEQQMLKKVSLADHKQQMESLHRAKSSEIKLVMNENCALKTRMNALSVEKDRLAIRVPNVAAENSELNMKIKTLETELRKVKLKLNQCIKKAEAATRQELAYRKSLAQVIKVAEKTVVDRNILADIVRKGTMSKQDRKHDNRVNDTVKYYYHSNNIDPDSCVFNFENMNFREKGNFSFECDDKNNNYNGDNNINSGDKKIIDYDSADNSGDKDNIGVEFDRPGKVFDRNNIMEIRGKMNVPPKDLNKFRDKQEKELNQLKEMVRLKQAYIEHIQTNSPT